jgi:hypothetical protein
VKFILAAYLKSQALISDAESIMHYHKFNIMEQNSNYRMFAGFYPGPVSAFVDDLNKELSDAVFDVEDSVCLIYPVPPQKRT